MTNIPNKINDVFDELKTEITWLHARWKLYRQLYAESPKRIDFLNECAGVFFYVVQETLLDEVQVMLSKLTDPAQTSGHENLSLDQLQSRVEKHGDPHLAQRLRALLDDLHRKCKTFRVRRNKKLAHLDLATALQGTTNPLPGVSRQMIEDALAVLRTYMNEIQIHYDDSEQGYEHFIMHAADAEALLGILKHGIRYEELVQAGQIDFDDLPMSKWHDA
jgi:hypothetical protein